MMDNDNSLNKRPTFKRALRNISMTSIFITMMLIWLLLSVTSVLTLKQYAQKNLALTAATMTYSLEAAVVFADGPAATETLAAKLASTGLTHARMDGHTDNYGEDSYNEGLSLKRANVVADAWAMGGQIPRSNLTTQGLGKKYPIASNKTAQGRAENRRVAVVITTP
ncbi:OmpA family protein [Escherichia coli]|nr:OmpA family protein [Escherichia coli]